MQALLASTLPSKVEEIGAIAGIVSFVLMLALLGLYIVRAIELVAEAAVPIPLEQAEAREQIWTPEKEREAAGELWTPESGD